MQSGVHGGDITILMSTSPTCSMRDTNCLLWAISCGPAGHMGLVMRHFDAHVALAVRVLLDVHDVHESQIDDVDEQLGVDDVLEFFADGLFGDCHVQVPRFAYSVAASRTNTSLPSTLTSWTAVGSVAGMVSALPVRMSNRAPCRGQAT